MSTCEAATVRGTRCVHDMAYTRVLDGHPRRLCATHVRQARRGTLRLWQPWTPEENELLADPDAQTAEIAARLGRSETAVRLRRFYAEQAR